MIPQNISYALLAFLPALLNLGIIFYLQFRVPRGRATDIFSLFVIALLFWQAEDVIVRLCATEATARFWDRILCIGWQGLAPLVLHFVLSYAGHTRALRRPALVALYAPFIALYLLYQAVPDPTIFPYRDGWGFVNLPRPGTLDGLQRSLISLVVVAALVVLFRHALRLRHDRARRTQAFLIAFGMLLPTIQGIITQVVYPVLFQRPEIPVTSTFLTLFSVTTLVALRRHQLFNLSDALGAQQVLEQLKSIVFIVSPAGRILYRNPFCIALFGESGSNDPRSFFASAADYSDFVKQVFESGLSGKPTRSYVSTLVTSSGERVQVLVSADPVYNNRQVQGLLLVANDITEHLHTVEALRRSNERYDLISKATNDMVWDWDMTTGAIYRNGEGWKKIFGLALEREDGTLNDWLQFVHPDDRQPLLDLRQALIDAPEQEYFEAECRLLLPDGSIRHIIDRGFVMRDDAGNPVRLVGATQDITARKVAERELRREQVRRQKELTRATITAQENERQKIGLELHDNVNQILASAGLYLNMARSDRRHEGLFDKSYTLIQQAIQEIRRLSHSIIPPTLHGETLAEALGNLFENLRQGGGITVDLDLDPAADAQVAQNVRLTLYRIAQEQCNNIIKYAKASQVWVQLHAAEETLLLRIVDNGVGFDSARAARGVGLMNMRTRAQLHDGQAQVHSSPGHGCTLEVTFPLTPKAAMA
ncbi:PAS domain S-box protein [Flaviaesturariibacter amylovorans]|uniref:Oxygen sensor histidine kinase NreB n=1 Tax=Flaviaesturariibacter amylovorans TaxID=1084520 RepID=A0ABP8H0K7_9BACT